MIRTLPPVAHCRRCGQRIRWVHTHGGRPMAISEHPDPRGRVLVSESEDGQHWIGEVRRSLQAEELRARNMELFALHSATCTALHIR